jgi:hypothetical protein
MHGVRRQYAESIRLVVLASHDPGAVGRLAAAERRIPRRAWCVDRTGRTDLILAA